MTDRECWHFVFRALWIIMWLIYKNSGDRSDGVRIERWRYDYYNVGGGTIETSGDEFK